jgi:hypothetical protein
MRCDPTGRLPSGWMRIHRHGHPRVASESKNMRHVPTLIEHINDNEIAHRADQE